MTKSFHWSEVFSPEQHEQVLALIEDFSLVPSDVVPLKVIKDIHSFMYKYQEELQLQSRFQDFAYKGMIESMSDDYHGFLKELRDPRRKFLRGYRFFDPELPYVYESDSNKA